MPWYQPSLPHGLSLEEIQDWARPFAPRLFFHLHERHFPSDPERFRADSRFREALEGRRDRGWHKESGWETSNRRGADYVGVDWKTIEGETSNMTGDYASLDPTIRPTLRPRGRRNLNRAAGRPNDGLFLERNDALDRTSSGRPPMFGVVTAPVFLDIVTVDTNAGRLIKVLFWFFYELNYWRGFLTHEGDWEHVTYLASVDDIQNRRPPGYVYFAQHNTGEVRPFSSLSSSMGSHPDMYVDRHGHPTLAEVADPGEYVRHWNIWEQEWLWVRDQDWRDFSGAWGEVGQTKHTTGPTGPWFKQGADLVRVRRNRNGRLEVSVARETR